LHLIEGAPPPGRLKNAEGGGIVTKMEAAGMKRLSRGLVIALVVVVALVSYNITFPVGKSAASDWKFVLTHPTLLLHVIVATGILVMAVIALIRSVRSRDRAWMALSVAGLAFVLAAFVSGEIYVMSSHNSALNYMSIGWAGAVITYGTGWYLGHRRERREEAAPLPER
jgi:peptidoglycan/LPS O-acetylase OafA/YrhL